MARRLSVVDVDRCVGCQACMFACARRLGQGGLADACIGVRSAGGIRRETPSALGPLDEGFLRRAMQLFMEGL